MAANLSLEIFPKGISSGAFSESMLISRLYLHRINLSKEPLTIHVGCIISHFKSM